MTTATQATASDVEATPPTAGATFAELGVAEDLVRALDRAGILEPFPIQELALPDILAGRDVCGKARTGSGKTLAFGIPLIQHAERGTPRKPRSLILVPTRELARQITGVLAPYARVRGLKLCAVYGGASMSQQIQAFRASVDIVIATPGRLNDLLDRNEVSVAEVSQVVLDEADQMADMGFLPQVQRILSRLQGRAQTLLFSATLDDAVSVLARRYQHDPVRHEVDEATEATDAVEERFIRVELNEKVRTAAQLGKESGRTLIFSRTQRGAERLAKQLQMEGVSAACIHGGLSQSQRDRVLGAFAKGTIPVLVATNLAARGLHIEAIDLVIHYDLPDDYKTYVHRSGRTARAGATGQVVTLVLPHERRDGDRLQRGPVVQRPLEERITSFHGRRTAPWRSR